MSPRVRRFTTLALLAGVALPLMVGCPALLSAFIRLKICVQNDTYLDLKEFNVATADAPSWGPNDLPSGILLPGDNDVIENVSPGTYDLRGVFDDKEDCVEDDEVILNDVEMGSTNLLVTFEQLLGACDDIYATLDYVL